MPSPTAINFYTSQGASNKLSDWNLLPKKPNWAKEFLYHWTPGEIGARQRLKTFLSDAIIDYDHDRDYPAQLGTSKLSPHLHFGEVSARQIWHKAQVLLAEKNRFHQSIETFIREIGWREFSYHLLYHCQTLPKQAFRPAFKQFPWKKNETHLQAWQRGLTGFPLIDAGMRELWATGWMHNRVRMVVASFLVKNLLISWQTGEKWFWDTLVDADLGCNSASWQWVAGSGADAAPYFRIFNPITQSEKFDKDGEYIRRWVPELKKLPSRYIHSPSDAPEHILSECGIKIGKDYPKPLVDLKVTRQRALDAYKKISG